MELVLDFFDLYVKLMVLSFLLRKFDPAWWWNKRCLWSRTVCTNEWIIDFLKLRYDASIAIMNLNSIVNRLAGLDGSYASRKAMITVASKGETPLLMFIKDDWPELGLGGINSSNLKSKIGAKE